MAIRYYRTQYPPKVLFKIRRVQALSILPWQPSSLLGPEGKSERELEAERARQQRIRDKTPGLRTKSTKVGEIDGMLISSSFSVLTDLLLVVIAVLEQVKDGWEFVIDPDVWEHFSTL